MAIQGIKNIFGERRGELIKKQTIKIINFPPGTWTNNDAQETHNSANWGHYNFDDTVEEAVNTSFVVPDDYDGGEIYVNLYWTAQSTSGDVRWRVAWNTREVGEDKDATGFTTGNEGVDAAPTNADEIQLLRLRLNYTTSIVIKDGDIVAMEIARRGDHASDDMTGDAKLLHVTVEYTGV